MSIFEKLPHRGGGKRSGSRAGALAANEAEALGDSLAGAESRRIERGRSGGPVAGALEKTVADELEDAACDTPAPDATDQVGGGKRRGLRAGAPTAIWRAGALAAKGPEALGDSLAGAEPRRIERGRSGGPVAGALEKTVADELEDAACDTLAPDASVSHSGRKRSGGRAVAPASKGAEALGDSLAGAESRRIDRGRSGWSAAVRVAKADATLVDSFPGALAAVANKRIGGWRDHWPVGALGAVERDARVAAVSSRLADSEAFHSGLNSSLGCVRAHALTGVEVGRGGRNVSVGRNGAVNAKPTEALAESEPNALPSADAERVGAGVIRLRAEASTLEERTTPSRFCPCVRAAQLVLAELAALRVAEEALDKDALAADARNVESRLRVFAAAALDDEEQADALAFGLPVDTASRRAARSSSRWRSCPTNEHLRKLIQT